MLSLNQLILRIPDLSAGSLSISEFEDWFRAESRDFHLWDDPDLKDAVFAVEGILSEYHFAEMPEGRVVEEMANTLRPFERNQAGSPEPRPVAQSNFDHASTAACVA